MRYAVDAGRARDVGRIDLDVCPEHGVAVGGNHGYGQLLTRPAAPRQQRDAYHADTRTKTSVWRAYGRHRPHNRSAKAPS